MSAAQQIDANSLKTISRQSREKFRPSKSFCDPVSAGFAAREKSRIVALAYTAANLAAAERKRHGRDSTPDEKADAAQDALLWAYSQERPSSDSLTDSERPSVSSFDGSREGMRPCRDLIAAAGKSLDEAHKGRMLLDPAAGGGDLLTASAESREAGDSRRSVSSQVVDPTVSPIPPAVGEGIRMAGIWPDDPTRQAMLDLICPDLTASDWIEAGEKGNSAAAIRKRRERGTGSLEADPKARTAAEYIAASLEPTEAERREAERTTAARLLEANPDGAKREAQKLQDPAWRMNQPYVQPLKISLAEVDISV
jgi:hypothetical protein